MGEVYNPEEDSFLLSKILENKIPNLLKKNKNLKFLEIGSGSGINLQTALKCGVKKENIFSSDINPKAVKFCKNLGFNSLVSDLFEAFKRKVTRRKPWCPLFDLIIFNPPYLPEDSKEPKDSKLITTGGKNGSGVINKFLKQSKKHLEKDGKIFLLISSLTKETDFLDYNKKIIGKENLFFEKLFVWELSNKV